MVIIRTKLLTRDKGYLFLNFFPSRYKEATLYISEGYLKTYEESKFFSKTTEVGPKESKDDPKVFEIVKTSVNNVESHPMSFSC